MFGAAGSFERIERGRELRRRLLSVAAGWALMGQFAITLSAQPAVECRAAVDYKEARLDSDGRNWSLVFNVKIEDCEHSSGRFDFEIEIVDATNSRRESVEKRETWTFNDTENGAVVFLLLLNPGEEVAEVSVDGTSIACTCRVGGILSTLSSRGTG